MGRVCVRVYGGEEGEDREDGRGICRATEEGEKRGYGDWVDGKEEGERKGGPETCKKNSHSGTKCQSETLTP